MGSLKFGQNNLGKEPEDFKVSTSEEKKLNHFIKNEGQRYQLTLLASDVNVNDPVSIVSIVNQARITVQSTAPQNSYI